jgi:hypothetical protein
MIKIDFFLYKKNSTLKKKDKLAFFFLKKITHFDKITVGNYHIFKQIIKVMAIDAFIEPHSKLNKVYN